jgi:hypothetical protein
MTNSNHPLSDLINQTGTEIQEKKRLRRKEGRVRFSSLVSVAIVDLQNSINPTKTTRTTS